MKTCFQQMRFAPAFVKYALCTLGLALLGCTLTQAQPVQSLILVQHPTSTRSGQLNEPLIINAPPSPPDNGRPGKTLGGGTWVFNAPPPPPDIGKPKTTGGGSRGCESEAQENQSAPSGEKPLTALIPETGWGLTTAEQPTLWFYVPYSSSLSGEFVLMDEANQTVYQTPLTLTGAPGVVSLPLSSKAARFETGKRYHWYFNIYCKPEQPPLFVEGWIQRVELNPNLKTQLEKATLQERVALYADNGIWHDALTASAELRRTDPKNNDWAALLQAIGRNDVVSEPIVECCQPGN